MLEEANELDDVADRLELLRRVQPEDADQEVLLQCHMALCNLMGGDLDAAEQHINRAEEHGTARAQTRTLRINLSVQRARLATLRSTPINASELTAARDDALRLRDELLGEARYEEPVRLLMLAADATLIDAGPGEAAQILGLATTDELNWPSAAAVLGEVALRAQDPRRARSLTAGCTGNWRNPAYSCLRDASAYDRRGDAARGMR